MDTTAWAGKAELICVCVKLAEDDWVVVDVRDAVCDAVCDAVRVCDVVNVCVAVCDAVNVCDAVKLELPEVLGDCDELDVTDWLWPNTSVAVNQKTSRALSILHISF